SFTKKCDGHKLCTKLRSKSSFDQFFVHHLINSKYWPFLMYYPIKSLTSTVLRKNVTVIKFAQCRVSIDFSCSVSKIQNNGHSQCISPWEVVRARFHEKT
ncbi:hypothetical protein B296_00001444, partial [Ensete ventricosum]